MKKSSYRVLDDEGNVIGIKSRAWLISEGWSDKDARDIVEDVRVHSSLPIIGLNGKVYAKHFKASVARGKRIRELLPTHSLRAISRETGIPFSTVQRIVSEHPSWKNDPTC